MDWVNNPSPRLLLFLVALHLPLPASAMCGFFAAPLPTGKAQVAAAKLGNTASQVVLLRKGTRTSMTLSNNYKGPAENFALVVPVPVVLKKEDVKTLSPDVLKHLETLSAPRLLETWENDPCYASTRVSVASMDSVGRSSAQTAEPAAAEPTVKIEAKFEVGEYEIVILSALDASGLERWLQLNGYLIPPGAAAALAPYVRDQMKFFVAKVDMSKVHRDPSGVVVLSPLRFAFDAPELRLPVRLGLLNADGKQDLLVYVLHPSKRFEVANYPNLFIPTNLEVEESVRSQFSAFYATLFNETLRRSGGRGVITEYAWNTDSCDSCPIQKLRSHELYLLGDDELAPRQSPTSARVERQVQAAPHYVLTRLHAHYDRQTLSEDLIFHEAAPIAGGRDVDTGSAAGPAPRNRNNFQARYTIRHYWRGAITCSTPQYRQWLRTPLGRGGYSRGRVSSPQAATNMAHAPQDPVNLQAVVRTAVPNLDLPGIQLPLRRREKR